MEKQWATLNRAEQTPKVRLDNIEEEFTAKRVSANAPAGKNPLDELFGKP